MVVTVNIENKIDRVFDYIASEKISFQESKQENESALASTSVDSYGDIVKTYDRWLQEHHGISIDRAKPRHFYEYMEQKVVDYQNGNGSAWTLRKIPHAIHAFQEASALSKVFKHKCKVGDKRVVLNSLTERGIFRRAKDSKSLKANDADFQKIQERVASCRSIYKEYVSNVHESQRQITLRIHEAVKLQVRDINFKTGVVTVNGKGGLIRDVKVRSKNYLEKLRGLCAGKKPGADVFRTQNKKGDPPSREHRMAIAKERIRIAAEQAGVCRNGKRYTTHSGRKAYSQERFEEMKKYSQRRVQKEFDKLCKNKRIKQKADEALNDIRKKIKPENRDKREFTNQERILFMISCEIGHFRLNVMRYYVEY
ncbi:TPA: recombinase XerD [Bacillus pacificus]